jgi:hypothetical protein
MHKNEHLVFACLVKHFFIDNIIHGLESLESLLFGHSNVLLLQRHRAETVVKVEEALKKHKFFTSSLEHKFSTYRIRLHTQKCSDIVVIGESGTETDNPYILLSRLNATDGSRHQGFQDWTSLVVEQMNFILLTKMVGQKISRIFEIRLTIITRRASWVKLFSPPFLVMISHFSGVHTMT